MNGIRRRFRFAACWFGAAMYIASSTLCAQTVHPDIPDSQLTQVGKDLDKRLFDAFNQCKLDALTAMHTPYVEFYHDLNGRILNREQFVAAVKRNICGKAQRRLVESSLEVHPMAKVGMILAGQHCFFEVGKNQCIQTARFFMLWKFDGKEWHVSRVFSYDHQDITS